MSASAELVSIINDIRLDFGRGQGTLGEVRDRVMEIARRAIAEYDALPEQTCKHCERSIHQSYPGSDEWIDREATGDDSVWRSVCDEHDTVMAEHEPKL